MRSDGLQWAIGQWEAEVKYRPRTNIYRPVLDSTWRQVIRYFGGNDVELLGCEVQIVVEKREPLAPPC